MSEGPQRSFWGGVKYRFVDCLGALIFLPLLYALLAFLVVVLGLVQVLFWILRGRHEPALADFCLRCLGYVVHVVSYVTLLSPKVPFPFGGLRSLDLEKVRALVDSIEGESLREFAAGPGNSGNGRGGNSGDGKDDKGAKPAASNAGETPAKPAKIPAKPAAKKGGGAKSDQEEQAS